MPRATSRNAKVEEAVDFFLNKLDLAIDGAELQLPDKEGRNACRSLISSTKGSVRLASIFLASYSVVETSWDFNCVPTGIRGKYGDKRLAQEINSRNVTIHNSITAFGENLGWKGNVVNVRLKNDPRFSSFVNFLSNKSVNERENIVNFLAFLTAESVVIVNPLPPISDDVLTYGRSVSLFSDLLSLPTEGHVPQFLVTSILKVHRDRYNINIVTHHPHASDKFDESAGDIEEFYDDKLLSAYEVTVRDDWKNRLGDFRDKMYTYNLKKYVIIASNVSDDVNLASPSALLKFTDTLGVDIAIVDIFEFCKVFAAELSSEEIRNAVNYCFELMNNPKLCGRVDFIQLYQSTVDSWLE